MSTASGPTFLQNNGASGFNSPCVGLSPLLTGASGLTVHPSQKDTTLTKIFVGGLPYHTTDESLRKFFEQFGTIEEAVVITDRQTGKSRGYGFVTMARSEEALLAIRDPNPCIDGRKANVNLAVLGAKPRQIPGTNPMFNPLQATGLPFATNPAAAGLYPGMTNQVSSTTMMNPSAAAMAASYLLVAGLGGNASNPGPGQQAPNPLLNPSGMSPSSLAAILGRYNPADLNNASSMYSQAPNVTQQQQQQHQQQLYSYLNLLNSGQQQQHQQQQHQNQQLIQYYSQLLGSGMTTPSTGAGSSSSSGFSGPASFEGSQSSGPANGTANSFLSSIFSTPTTSVSPQSVVISASTPQNGYRNVDSHINGSNNFMTNEALRISVPNGLDLTNTDLSLP